MATNLALFLTVLPFSSSLLQNTHFAPTAFFPFSRSTNSIHHSFGIDQVPFACKCFILNTKDNLEKFDSKSDNGTFLGYFETSKAFRVYSSRTLAVEETIHLKFNENEPDNDLSKLDESFADLRLDDAIKKKESSNQSSEVRVSTHHLDDPQEEVREPTGCFIRRNHLGMVFIKE